VKNDEMMTKRWQGTPSVCGRFQLLSSFHQNGSCYWG